MDLGFDFPASSDMRSVVDGPFEPRKWLELSQHLVDQQIAACQRGISASHQYADPVFDGMARDFATTALTFEKLLGTFRDLTEGIEVFCGRLAAVSDVFIDDIARVTDQCITSDCCQTREAFGHVSRGDAPHSLISKFNRDLNFNVIEPLTAHVRNNREIKRLIELRDIYLERLVIQKCVVDTKGSGDDAPSAAQRKSAFDEALTRFQKFECTLVEWLVMLEEYKQDIYDSVLQTTKYLLYEFFAGSSHCISDVLPRRMEFRPLSEMTPAELKLLVDMELNETLDFIKNKSEGSVEVAKYHNASAKLLRKLQTMMGDHECAETQEAETITADPLSVRSLVAQGFSEAQAKVALISHENQLQAALDCLLEGHVHQPDLARLPLASRVVRPKAEVVDNVRVPSTLRWLEKLQQYHAKRHEPPSNAVGASALAAESHPSDRSASSRVQDNIFDFDCPSEAVRGAQIASSADILIDLMMPDIGKTPSTEPSTFPGQNPSSSSKEDSRDCREADLVGGPQREYPALPALIETFSPSLCTLSRAFEGTSGDH